MAFPLYSLLLGPHNAIELDGMDPLANWVVDDVEPIFTEKEINKFERNTIEGATMAIGIESQKLKNKPKAHVEAKDLPLPCPPSNLRTYLRSKGKTKVVLKLYFYDH